MSKPSAADNRRLFPETAKVIDEFRRVFGPDVKLKWATENGRSPGKVPVEYEETHANAA